MMFDDAHVRFLATHHLGRLATIAPDGTPQNKPVGYGYNTEFGTIDIGGMNMAGSAKYRNIATHPQVAFVVDDAVGEGATGMRFLEVRGAAEHARVSRSGSTAQIIRISPRRAVSWNIDEARPGLQTFTDAGAAPAPRASRPTLARASDTPDAMAAVARLVDELQRGWDEHDADVANRHFANDVMWGSPFGATVRGYAELHAIHVRLKKQGRGGPASRFELVQTLAPRPDVILAHVRRFALDADGQPVPPSPDFAGPFSEMALYVLIRRGREWWLSAGQNTPIRPGPGSPTTNEE
jgi:PPOX class F420-dependent enzyme/OxyR family protein/uncharacterized protein (TIGR02246 family)